jgi:glutathione S-transferase
MRLYYFPISANARRAVVTAFHLNAKVDLAIVNLPKGEHRRPEYLKMNPNGRVPTLDDDGFYLTESHAIMQYLADLTPGQTVYPTAPRARADVNRWLFWNSHHFTPSCGILNFEHFVKGLIGQGGPDEAQVKRGEAQVADCMRVLDQHLADKTWIAQGQLTLADLAIASTLILEQSGKLSVRGFAHVMAWFARVQELDAWKKAQG